MGQLITQNTEWVFQTEINKINQIIHFRYERSRLRTKKTRWVGGSTKTRDNIFEKISCAIRNINQTEEIKKDIDKLINLWYNISIKSKEKTLKPLWVRQPFA